MATEKPELLSIFRPAGLGTLLNRAAMDYLAEYEYDPVPDEFVSAHTPTEFERGMMEDMIAGLFSDEHFSGLLQDAARSMKVDGRDPCGPDI